MLEPHPPHHTPNTWRDFFIHIATIVVGLLIAIGLEQTVEYIHHNHELAETREALRAERESNRKLFAQQVVYFRRETAALQNDLDVLLYLQAHPGAPPQQLPGVLTWHYEARAFPEAAWTTAQQANVTALMSRAEVEQYSSLYDKFHHIDARVADYQTAVFEATRYSVQDSDPTHLTPTALTAEIELTKTVLIKHLQHGIFLFDLATVYPDVSLGRNLDDLGIIVHFPDHYPPEFAAPLARTIQKIDAAGKADDYFPQASAIAQPATSEKH